MKYPGRFFSIVKRIIPSFEEVILCLYLMAILLS